MGVAFQNRLQRWTGWLAVILFVVFAANIVAAKFASLAGVRIPLIPNLIEFFLLHGATVGFIAYALSCEARDPPKDEE